MKRSKTPPETVACPTCGLSAPEGDEAYARIMDAYSVADEPVAWNPMTNQLEHPAQRPDETQLVMPRDPGGKP